MGKIKLSYTEKDIIALADSSTIFGKGKSYFKNGRVKSIDIQGRVIFAEVKGTTLYEVDITLSKTGKIEDADCDCPYGGPGCKHVTAVLFEVLTNHIDFNFEKTKSTKNSKSEKDSKNNITDKISLEYVEEKTSKKDILKGLDILNSLKIKISQIGDDFISAIVDDDDEDYKVIIRKPMPLWDDSFDSYCTCYSRRKNNSFNCHHISAVSLFFALKNTSKEDLKKYYDKIKYESENEDFLSFSKIFESDEENILKNNFQKQFLVFKVIKEYNTPTICIMKSAILKNGSFGAQSIAQEKNIIDNKEFLPLKIRKIMSEFLLLVKSENNYGYSNFKCQKTKFLNDLDFEFLKNLKDLYLEYPLYFSNFKFSDKKAKVMIDFLDNGDDKLKFKVEIYDGTNFYPSNSKDLYWFSDSNWIIFSDLKNEDFIIFEMETDDIKFMKNVSDYNGLGIKKEFMHDFIEKNYAKLSKIGEINLPNEYNITEESVEPKARIYLFDYADIFRIELRFLYNSSEVLFESTSEIIFKNENNKLIKVKRDKEKEGGYHMLLLDNHVFEKDDILLPSINPYEWLCDISKKLICFNFEIFGKDTLLNQKIIDADPEINIEISSGIDWFGLKGELNFGDEKVEFSKLLESLKNHDRFVLLSDGKKGVIPKKWLEKLSGVAGLLNYDKKNDIVKVSKSHIAIIESLLDISKQSKVDKKYDEIRNKFKKFKEIKDVPLPSGLNAELRNYQVAGYNWLHFLKEFSFGGCLADEMGLGKTVQVLSLLLHEKENNKNLNPSLVVVPTSLVFNWVNEVKKFVPDIVIHVHHGTERIKDLNNVFRDNPDIIITTYGTLRNDIDMFKKEKFHYIILDESQAVKNPLSQIAKSVYSLKSKYRLVLTGTPIENNSLELWSQFAFLNPGFLGSMDYFKNTFSKSIDVEKNKDKQESLKNMINPFLLLRKKDNVASDLPKKQITTIYCDMDESQREVYNFWKQKFRVEIMETISNEGFMKSRMKILAGLTKLRQISCHPRLIDESYVKNSGKFTILIDMIKEVISENHKVLVFSSFVKMLHVIKNKLEEEKIKFSYLDGETKDRQKVVEEFQSDSDIKIFLISLKAGGLGLNLTAADYVFIVDPWWNPAAEMQAIDRAHRIGQDKPVFVYKMITKDSVEEKILELQESKMELVKNVISVEEGIFKDLKKEDIDKMFR